MKSTELRIGNFVQGINRRTEIHLPDNLPIKILQVEIFNCEALPLDKNPAMEKEWFKISNTDLTPIPLTEEWLKKFGFEKDGEYLWHNNIALYTNENGGFNYNASYFEHDNLISIEYVHELQNLYYTLTKEELVLAVNPL